MQNDSPALGVCGDKQALAVRCPNQIVKIAPSLHVNQLEDFSSRGENVDWAGRT